MRYSPAECFGCERKAISGNPGPKWVNTSYIERQNLTMRMQMRRFTRLTNAFSKKVENHMAAIGIPYMHYNFCRIHRTLRLTPAMQAAGIRHIVRGRSRISPYCCGESPEKVPGILSFTLSPSQSYSADLFDCWKSDLNSSSNPASCGSTAAARLVVVVSPSLKSSRRLRVSNSAVEICALQDDCVMS